jgi:mannosyltransferase
MTESQRRSNSSTSQQLPIPWAWLAGLTVLATWLRVIGVNKGLWLDEIYFLVDSVRQPLIKIVTSFPGDNQHPLYTILARLSILAFGEHPWSLRLPAVVFGVAAVPALYFLGTAIASRLESLLAAALLAVSYHHVWFSQNARGYTALAFWAILSTFFLLRGIQTGRRGPYIGYAVAASLGVYTLITMIFLVASHVLVCAALFWTEWRSQDPKKWKFPLQGFLLTGGLTLLFYSPIALEVRNFFMHRPSRMKAVSTPRWALWETVRSLTIGLGGVEIVLLVAAILAMFGAWSYFKKDRVALALFVLPGICTALGAVLARGTMYPRFYFSFIGFGVLILVRGIFAISEWIAERWPRRFPGLAPALTAALAVILLASSAYSLAGNYKYPKQDFEGAVQFVDSVKKDGEIVVTAGASTYPMQQYYAKSWESAESVEKLQELCRQGRVVWLVYTFPRYLEAAVPGITVEIRKKFTVVKVFPGTLGDGDLVVSKFQPVT